MGTQAPEMTPEQAQQLLRKAEAEKMKKCQQEIEAVLVKYNCALDVFQQIRVLPKQQTPQG